MNNTEEVRTKVGRRELTKEQLIQTESDTIEMTLNSENSLASGLLIQRLTELYENPIEASVRETVSNAIDSITGSKNGKAGEIYISQPSKLNPVFVVKDNGVGMNYEDLKNVYSKYGASTKTNNFNQVGAYGLGAKAPLAYGTEFVVTSVKNGEKVSIMVVREELNNYIKVLSRTKTDEENGTTVSIPVASEDVHEFIEKIENYKKYPLEHKNLSIFIDEQLVSGGRFELFSEDLVVFEESKEGKTEEIKAKVWFESSLETAVEFLSSFSELSLIHRIRYIIGGWAYKSPKSKNNYYGGDSHSKIAIELKPGILSFNSSRDVILSNENLDKFERRILDYIKSEEFHNRLIEFISSAPIEEFKRLVTLLLKKRVFYQSKIKNEELYSLSITSSISKRKTLFREITHETGFNFLESIFSMENFEDYSYFRVLEKKERSKKRSASFIEEEKTHANYKPSTSKALKEVYEGIFSGEKEGSSLQKVLFNSFASFYGDHKENNILIVTDVDFENNRKNSDNALKFRNSLLNGIFYKDESAPSEYSFSTIYTDLEKEKIERLIASSSLFNSLVIKTVDELDEIRKNLREKSSSPKKTKEKEEFLLELLAYDYKEIDKDSIYGYEKVTIKELEKTKDNYDLIAFIPKKKNTFERITIEKMRVWLANKYNFPVEKVLVVVSVGIHRKQELDSILKVGVFYEYNESCGTSNYYDELTKDNKVGQSLLLNSDKNKKDKSLRFILENAAEKRIEDIHIYLINLLRDLEDMNKIIGIKDLNFNLDFENILKIKDFDSEDVEKVMSLSFTKNLYNIEKIKYISDDVINCLSKEDKQLIEYISILISYSFYYRSKQVYMDNQENLVVSYKKEFISSLHRLSLMEVSEKYNSKENTFSMSIEKDIIEFSLKKIHEILVRISEIKVWRTHQSDILRHHYAQNVWA